MLKTMLRLAAALAAVVLFAAVLLWRSFASAPLPAPAALSDPLPAAHPPTTPQRDPVAGWPVHQPNGGTPRAESRSEEIGDLGRPAPWDKTAGPGGRSGSGPDEGETADSPHDRRPAAD